jgi:hypothetical protein
MSCIDGFAAAGVAVVDAVDAGSGVVGAGATVGAGGASTGFWASLPPPQARASIGRIITP